MDYKKDRVGFRNHNPSGYYFTVIEYEDSHNVKIRFDNGEERITEWANVKRGTVALPSISKEKHGERYTKLWKEWNTMKWRCNPKNKRHHVWYSDKGITVCEEWNVYSNFKKWALENGFEENLTIDRIDETKNYCPENCRWITLQENVRRISFSKNWVAIDKYSLNGDYICTYPNLSQVCKSLGKEYYNTRKIKKCCDGLLDEYQGYVWKYANK